MGHSLALSVVAEGVETDQQFAYLKQYGCQIFQGCFFDLPITAIDYMEYLSVDSA
jgi:EAL domain-containing protein (putative c-di-GMP-specific phosphodiesterase class I)